MNKSISACELNEMRQQYTAPAAWIVFEYIFVMTLYTHNNVIELKHNKVSGGNWDSDN